MTQDRSIDDGIQWDRFGANPSPLRTAYVAAYLQIGAPDDISGIFRPLIPGYNAQTVRDIVRAHSRWSGLPRESPKRRALQEPFLKGNYKAVLK